MLGVNYYEAEVLSKDSSKDGRMANKKSDRMLFNSNSIINKKFKKIKPPTK